MATQDYKVVKTYAHKIPGWIIISRLIHSCTPHIKGMNDDFQYDLSTLAFNNVEQLEYLHSRILRLQ